MSKKCYLAGAMRGHPNLNFPAFNEAEKFLNSDGWEVINPAAVDWEHDESWTTNDPNVADENYEITTADCRRVVRRDVNYLLSLRRENNDALIMLPGWETSIGATAEYQIALWLKLPIFELFNDQLLSLLL